MSSSATTRSANPTADMTKSSLLQSLTISTARSVGSPCERCIQVFQQFTSKVQGFIQQIQGKRHAVLTSTFTNMLDASGTLQARAPRRAHSEPLTRRARWVAAVIGIALSIANAPSTQGSIDAIESVHLLADKQLTEKQEYCHDQITFLESSNNKNANNGSHWGYYQGRSKVLKGAPDDYQFYWYWSYVSHRYGITQYDEPNYCNALHHLRVKGWQ